MDVVVVKQKNNELVSTRFIVQISHKYYLKNENI